MNSMKQDNELNLNQLISIFWKEKFKIITLTFISSVIGVLVAINLPNIYKSEAVLAPTDNDTSQANLLASPGLGSIAQMAGIKATSERELNSLMAIEVLRSREFFSDFNSQYNILVPLMAASGWIEADNELIIDPDVYDTFNKKWVREVPPTKSSEPSIQEAHLQFLDILSVSRDKVTGLVRVGIKHYSPYVAKDWVDLIVLEINERMRQEDVNRANLSMEYLKDEIQNTKLSELRSLLFSLVQQQIQIIMLAEASPEYLFKTIDSAVVPELKIEPKRPVIAIMSFIIGFLISIIIVISLHFRSLIKKY